MVQYDPQNSPLQKSHDLPLAPAGLGADLNMGWTLTWR